MQKAPTVWVWGKYAAAGLSSIRKRSEDQGGLRKISDEDLQERLCSYSVKLLSGAVEGFSTNLGGDDSLCIKVGTAFQTTLCHQV